MEKLFNGNEILTLSQGKFEQLASNLASAVNQLYLSVKERKTKELVGLIKDGGVKNGTKKLS